MPEVIAPSASVTTQPNSNVVESAVSKPPTATSQTTTAPKLDANESKEKEPKVRKEKLKIDGQEVEWSVDEMKVRLQKELAAEKRWLESKREREAAERLYRQIEERESKLRPYEEMYGQDAFKYLLSQHQNDPQKMAQLRQAMEEHLIEQIKLEQASPEVQELYRIRQENERLKKEKERERKELEARQFQSLVETNRKTIQAEIIETLKKSGLPATEWNIKKVADLKAKALKLGLKPSPDQLASLAKHDTIEHIRALGSEYTTAIPQAYKAGDFAKVTELGRQMVEVYGEDLLKALRCYDLVGLKGGQVPMPEKIVETAQAVSAQPQKPLSWDEEKERSKAIARELQATWVRRA